MNEKFYSVLQSGTIGKFVEICSPLVAICQDNLKTRNENFLSASYAKSGIDQHGCKMFTAELE